MKADRLLVHSVDDLNRLKPWGLYQNATLFHQGVLARSARDLTRAKRVAGIPDGKMVIASYGFLLPHKGLEQLIKAFSILKRQQDNLLLLMVNALYPAFVSDETWRRCVELAKQKGVEKHVIMVTDFLPDEESYGLLDTADLIVFPYQETAESSSAAIRYGLATHRPVACSPLKIFTDVKEVVHFLPGTTPEDIATGIEEVIQNFDKLSSKQKIQDKWLAAHSWDVLAKRLGGMIKGLLLNFRVVI